MLRMPYVKDELQAAKLAAGMVPLVGMSVHDGCWYGGTEEELKRIGCINTAPVDLETLADLGKAFLPSIKPASKECLENLKNRF